MKYGNIEIKEFKKDKLTVKAMNNRTDMGKVAAADIRECMLALLSKKEEINMIFAAAPSQNDVLASLIEYDDIPWERVNGFHMDEYIGLPKNAPQAFGNFLVERIFSKVPFKSVNLIDSSLSKEEAIASYSALLKKYPTDIVVMGIGENGHIAFNDPPVADFNDKMTVKAVELDLICRNQQVHDGCFEKLSDVPTHALTLTCPTLAGAPYQFCVVPAPTKADAVYHMLNDGISEKCPATVLRRCEAATLYLDGDSSAKI